MDEDTSCRNHLICRGSLPMFYRIFCSPRNRKGLRRISGVSTRLSSIATVPEYLMT